MPTVLNVGAGPATEIPAHYSGWKHLRLDIDPKSGADVVCDARLLEGRIPPATYDAIYCCHNLEHYYPHEGMQVLRGFAHVLKPDGFAEFRVPDIQEVLEVAVKQGLDIEDELYMSPAGSIRLLDALWGWQEKIARSGNDFYAHKTGFSWKSLVRTLAQAQFAAVYRVPPLALFELRAIAFRQAPTDAQRKLFAAAI